MASTHAVASHAESARKSVRPKPATSKLGSAFKRVQAAAKSNVEQIVAARSLEAVADFLASADSRLLADIATAPNNYEVLLEQLSAPAFIKTVDDNDPLVRARLRGLKAKRELIEKGGGALSADQAARLLGITRQAVDLRRKQRQLLALETGKRGFAYPVWQFDEGVLSALPKVLATITPAAGTWDILNFFLNRNSYLNGKSPLEELRGGRAADVLRAASAFLSHGAA